ncbi:MAG: BstXI family restriction endonuclease [Candidatus Paceibacterota bacterium]
MAQAEGREVPDLTVTEINLFHINELRYGVYNHKPYNLSWGHHHLQCGYKRFWYYQKH